MQFSLDVCFNGHTLCGVLDKLVEKFASPNTSISFLLAVLPQRNTAVEKEKYMHSALEVALEIQNTPKEIQNTPKRNTAVEKEKYSS